MAFLTKFNALRIITSNDFKATGDLDVRFTKSQFISFLILKRTRLSV